jgi:magnesium-transporting ATPase (P-type)
VRVKMMTGDHRATAEAIGEQLSLHSDAGALSGEELSRMDDATLERAANEVNVFARVAPEHKLRLVRALQKSGNVVAMTGDGVNDAPALKQANIGVAMGITGTAAAKEAADVVLIDDNFASIEAAVEEGRRVYDNIIKSIAFLLPTNLGLALILLVAVLAFPLDEVGGQLVALLPMQPTQLLWINMVSGVSLALPLSMEASEPSNMLHPPRSPDAPVLGRFVVVRTVVAAVLMAGGAIAIFLWEYARVPPNDAAHVLGVHQAQTMAVTTVSTFQIFYVLHCRSLRDSLRKLGLWSNPHVYAGIALLLVLQAGFIYLPFMQVIFETAPLDARQLGLCVLVGAIILPAISLEKALARRVSRRSSARERLPRPPSPSTPRPAHAGR